jgi:hypothetical protein
MLVVIMVTVVMVLVLLMKQRIPPMPHVSVMIIQRDNHIVLSRIHPPQTRIIPQTRIHPPQTRIHLHLHPKVGDKKIGDKIPVVNKLIIHESGKYILYYILNLMI